MSKLLTGERERRGREGGGEREGRIEQTLAKFRLDLSLGMGFAIVI